VLNSSCLIPDLAPKEPPEKFIVAIELAPKFARMVSMGVLLGHGAIAGGVWIALEAYSGPEFIVPSM